MGAVFRARDAQGRALALKTTHPNPPEQTLARFRREGDVLARLAHPGILALLDRGRAGETEWLALELIEGEDLARRLARGLPVPDELRRLLEPVAAAVAYAHGQGVVHRDLKPENVLLERASGRVVVADFGVAKDLERSRLTLSGIMVGTVPYMAPEQISGASDLGPPVDVWALGALIYRCLTGHPPIRGATYEELAAWHNGQRVTPPRELNPAADPALAQLALRCLAWEAADRPDAAEVADFLADEALGRPAPPPSRRLGWALLGLASVLCGGAVAGLSRRGEVATPAPSLAPSAGPSPDASLAREAAPRWSLGRDAPTLSPPLLWDAEGRRAEPLRGAESGDPRALAAAFAGAARRLEPGLVEVRYPSEALWVDVAMPGKVFRQEPHPFGRLGGGRLAAPNDTGGARFYVGRGRWREAGLACELRSVPAPWLDVASVVIHLESAQLGVYGRRGIASVRWSGGRLDQPFQLGDASWTAFELAPSAPVGRRALIDGAPLPGELQLAPTGEVRPSLQLSENQVELRRLRVRGRPTRADRPALAWAGPASEDSLRLEAEFRGESPCLVLAPPGGEPYALELGRGRLELRRGPQLLGVCELPDTSAPSPGSPFAGSLSLSREGATLRGALRVGPEVHRLERAEWRLAEGLALRPGYGATGAPTEFRRVDLFRRAAPPLSAGARAWRAGARALEQVSDPLRGDLSLRGGRRRAERVARAREAARLLAEAAEGLGGLPRADAAARLAWAAVIAADEALAIAAVAQLRASVPRGGSELLDWLQTYTERPHLLSALAQGYVTQVSGRDVTQAATRALLALGDLPRPGLRPEALSLLAECRAAGGQPEEALQLLEEAQRLSPRGELRGRSARILIQLERYEEALAKLEEIPLLERHFLHQRWLLEVRARLGRTAAAFEALCGFLARRAGEEDATRFFEQVLTQLRPRLSPALVALGCAILAERSEGSRAAEWRRRVVENMRQVDPARSPRENDLARYAMTLAGERWPTSITTEAERPSATLLRARLGDEAARTRLRLLAREDDLIRSLTLLDPELASLAR